MSTSLHLEMPSKDDQSLRLYTQIVPIKTELSPTMKPIKSQNVTF